MLVISSSEIWRVKCSIIKHYNRIASIYNILYGHEQDQKMVKALRLLDFSPFDLVLDVGCGTGLLFKYIANIADMVVGVDIAREPLKIARNAIRRFGLDRVLLVRADADFLPFKNGVFSKIFAITLLQNMPNPILTLSEITRVAKDEAAMVITGLKKIFSRKYFSEILRKAGLSFILLNDGKILNAMSPFAIKVTYLKA
ncbi:MAG: class I SAM-dependent methyltransferase [Thermoproteota archaeon]